MVDLGTPWVTTASVHAGMRVQGGSDLERDLDEPGWKEFGKWVEQLRVRTGLQVGEVAIRAGVSPEAGAFRTLSTRPSCDSPTSLRYRRRSCSPVPGAPMPRRRQRKQRTTTDQHQATSQRPRASKNSKSASPNMNVSWPSCGNGCHSASSA